MSLKRPATAMTIIAGGLLWSSVSSAQSVATSDASVDMFSRVRNVSVQQRPRPEFEAVGIRAGAFMVSPKVEWTVELNDNIYATETNETSDTVGRIRPEVSVDSNWSRNYLGAYARASINRYADNSSENTDEYGIGATGRLDVMRLSQLGAGADYSRTYEPRTSANAPSGAVEPVELKLGNAFVSGAHTAGRIKLSGRADARAYDYVDGRTGAGVVIDQDFRDRDVTSVLGRVDYALSPDTAVFVSASANDRKYDLAGTPALPGRDSTGTEYLVGANFELTNLVRGEVAVGYIEQDFDSPVYSDTSQASGRAQLEWFPTQLTTVTIAAGRSVEDAVNTGVGGFTSTSSSVSVDHELLRNVIVSGRLSYSDNDYEGIDRNDNTFGASLGATYLVNRNVGVNASLSTLQTKSEGLNRDDDFTVNRLSISLVTQF